MCRRGIASSSKAGLARPVWLKRLLVSEPELRLELAVSWCQCRLTRPLLRYADEASLVSPEGLCGPTACRLRSAVS